VGEKVIFLFWLKKWLFVGEDTNKGEMFDFIIPVIVIKNGAF